MSKAIGFRNSGKLDIGGKGLEYGLVVVLGAIIILAAVVIGTQFFGGGGRGSEPPTEHRVKCLKCNEEWMIDSKDVGKYQREIGRRAMGVDCPKCHARGSVFLMSQCPKCKEYYMPKSITSPDSAAPGDQDVCPKCGTNLRDWWREHNKRR